MRVTLAFVAIVGVIMICVLFTIATLADHSVENQLRDMASRINAETKPLLKQPDWRSRLDQFAHQPSLQDRGIGLIIFDTVHRKRLWQSSAHLPQPGARSRAYRMVPGGNPRSGEPLSAVLFIPTKEYQDFQSQRRTEFVGIILLTMVLVALGAFLLVGKTLSPIASLSSQAATASTDNLQIALTAPSQDAEIVDLVTTLNGLLGRIAQTSAAKGRFYAAASHELRTPLQALSGHLELALTRQRTAEEYEKVIGEAHHQAVRLIELVQDLLLLHQLDTSLPRDHEAVDLASAFHSAMEALEPLVELRNLTVDWDQTDAGEIHSIHSHAHILVRNILENAAKYADVGSHIQVALRRDQGAIVFEVVNRCAAAKALNVDKLFEPFYRPDVSRNSKTGGNGLGLAICRAIANANGWKIDMKPTDDTVAVTVVFEAEPEIKSPSKTAVGPKQKRAARAGSVEPSL